MDTVCKRMTHTEGWVTARNNKTPAYHVLRKHGTLPAFNEEILCSLIAGMGRIIRIRMNVERDGKVDMGMRFPTFRMMVPPSEICTFDVDALLYKSEGIYLNDISSVVI